LFLQSLDVEDVPSLLDICSLDPLPLYERMRTNNHILEEHQNDLGAAFDSRFVFFYSVLSGLFVYLRDVYHLPIDSKGYFSGTFNLDHLPVGDEATTYLESRGPALESELRQIPFFLQYFTFCEVNGHCSLKKYHDLLRAPAATIPKRVAKLTLAPTTVLSCRQVITTNGQVRFIEDARKSNLDTHGRYATALKNAKQVLHSTTNPDDILLDTPTVSLPMADGTRSHGQNPL
jgi:hypothetical protein